MNCKQGICNIRWCNRAFFVSTTICYNSCDEKCSWTAESTANGVQFVYLFISLLVTELQYIQSAVKLILHLWSLWKYKIQKNKIEFIAELLFFWGGGHVFLLLNDECVKNKNEWIAELYWKCCASLTWILRLKLIWQINIQRKLNLIMMSYKESL